MNYIISILLSCIVCLSSCSDSQAPSNHKANLQPKQEKVTKPVSKKNAPKVDPKFYNTLQSDKLDSTILIPGITTFELIEKVLKGHDRYSEQRGVIDLEDGALYPYELTYPKLGITFHSMIPSSSLVKNGYQYNNTVSKIEVNGISAIGLTSGIIPDKSTKADIVSIYGSGSSNFSIESFHASRQNLYAIGHEDKGVTFYLNSSDTVKKIITYIPVSPRPKTYNEHKKLLAPYVPMPIPIDKFLDKKGK